MMSSPARSMSRMAVSAASSNISSRSAGPYSPASTFFTVANHQPGLPWEPMTAEGMRGRDAIRHVLLLRGGRGVRADVGRSSREDDLAALDDVEPRGEVR